MRRKISDELARQNLLRLVGNEYPGRGIILGLDNLLNWVIIYFLTGRSDSSLNRMLEEIANGIQTVVADLSRNTGGNPDLLIYPAILWDRLKKAISGSNGKQTPDLLRSCKSTSPLETLANWQYEPDDPNFTARISLFARYNKKGKPADGQLINLSKESGSDECIRTVYDLHKMGLRPGIGFCLTTYSGNSVGKEPLPGFIGEPFPVQIKPGSIKQIAMAKWALLNEDKRIALAAVRFRPDGSLEKKIINRFSKAA